MRNLLTTAIAVSILLFASAGASQQTDGDANAPQAPSRRIEISKTDGHRIPIMPEPFGPRMGIAPSVRVDLPPLAMNKILEEDAALAALEKNMIRIGVFQEIPGGVIVSGDAASHGFWIPLEDGGYLWSIVIYAPDAVGQRVEFSAIVLPRSARLRLYNFNQPGECYDPLPQETAPSSVLWTPTCFGEEIVVECYAPTRDDLDGIHFRIERIAHIYQSASDIVEKGTAGPCNIDVTCHPGWAEAALAVGGMGTIGILGVFFCTCALIAHSQDCTEVPYVLTANHCVRQQTGSYGAEYVEFYWRYQTPTCNGTPPSPASVPRTTGGADFLAGLAGRPDRGGGNDFTFMRMRNLPPTGLTYLGWTTANVPVGADVTCIHHPRGDFKRISFGTKTNISNAYPQYYHELVWSSGTTEPGSSGSPLMLSSTQQVIGQLWGGGASCGTPDLPDYYGKFDVTYNYVSAYLDPGPAMVGFSATSLVVNENGGSATITVTLNAPSAGGVFVDYATAGGSAVPGVDFVPASGTLQFPRGERHASFAVTIFDDDEYIGDRNVILALSNSSCPQLDPAASVATLTILEDEPEEEVEMPSLMLPWFVGVDTD